MAGGAKQRQKEERPVLAGLIPPIRIGVDIDPLAAVCYIIVVVAACVAGVFFATALYLWTVDTYGILAAHLVLGAVFALIAALAAITIALRGRQAHIEAQTRALQAKQSKPEWWQDPMVVSVGIEAVRALGARRTLTLLAIASVIGGALMYRPPRV
jgi:hypothetical protein